MKKLNEWTNEENLELAVKELTEIIEILGNVNLTTQTYKKEHLKKLHLSYDMLLKLRHKLQKRLDSLEELKNV